MQTELAVVVSLLSQSYQTDLVNHVSEASETSRYQPKTINVSDDEIIGK